MSERRFCKENTLVFFNKGGWVKRSRTTAFTRRRLSAVVFLWPADKKTIWKLREDGRRRPSGVTTGQTSLHHHNVLQSDYGSASITQGVGSVLLLQNHSQSDQHNNQLKGLEAELIIHWELKYSRPKTKRPQQRLCSNSPGFSGWRTPTLFPQ